MTTKISTKIKTLGALLILFTMSVMVITIYINQKNIKNALVVNVAGKERMLSQKMSKVVFYNYLISSANFNELDEAALEFEANIQALQNGHIERGIAQAPNQEIFTQINRVVSLWHEFETNIKIFKMNVTKEDEKAKQLTHQAVQEINLSNNVLLFEIDKLVGLYTEYFNTMTYYIQVVQYTSGVILFGLLIYIFRELRQIEKNADEFFTKSKILAQNSFDQPLEPLQIQGEKEIVEVTDTINCFINKINSAVNYSQEALNFSKNASTKLEEISDEFGYILKEINDKELKKALNTTEDIAIQSTEDLINSTKKLESLKVQLDKLLSNCKEIKKI